MDNIYIKCSRENFKDTEMALFSLAYKSKPKCELITISVEDKDYIYTFKKIYGIYRIITLDEY